MNNCKTKIGARLLRSSILQPIFHLESLQKRVKCVEELVGEPEILLSVQVKHLTTSRIIYSMLLFP